MEEQKENPRALISPVTELPHNGAVIYMVGGTHAPQYFTVTPYSEIKAHILNYQNAKNEKA